MTALSQSVPPRIRTKTVPLGVFAGGVLGLAILSAGAVVYFLQPEHARILSHLPVPPIDGPELSRLRRNARGLRAAARKCCARTEGQRVVRDPDSRRRIAWLLVCGQKGSRKTGRGNFSGEMFMDVACRCSDFHCVAESAGVFISVAVVGVQASACFRKSKLKLELQPELFAFAGAPGGVQFQHESDTSIDNNDV